MKPQKSYQKLLRMYVIALMVLGSFLVGLFVGRENIANGTEIGSGADVTIENKNSAISKSIDFKLFWDVWDKIDAKFILRPVDYNKLYHGAIKGMVAALDDPYSSYMDPEETKSFNEHINGEFGGIGAELSIKNNVLVVVSVLPGTPAEKAGLLEEDIIVKIDDTDSSGLGLYQAVALIRGKEGTDVKLEIYREGEDATRDVSITRDVINVASVDSKIIVDEDNNSVLYISISTFAEKTYEELNKAIEANISQNPKAVILDLRGNSGGLLDQSVMIAGEFLDTDSVVAIEEFSDGKKKIFKTDKKPRLKDLPIIVLTNKGSASASEILAGALRDNRNVKLYGKQTFGKGTVQELISLGEGSSLRISVAKWLTPNETDINKEGLHVDTDIEITGDDRTSNRDPQLDKALQDVL